MSARLLTAIENVLLANARPLTAHRIASEINLRSNVILGGATPWKTVGARLAVDIRQNAESKFKRAGSGLYGLACWSDMQEVLVPARKINPMNEEILAVPSPVMRMMEQLGSSFGIYPIHYSSILASAVIVNRSEAERRDDLVQIIPSFIINRGDEILSFKRTKKTPESRLHDSFSIMFGGHLQANDVPSLFDGETHMEQEFLFRELREELLLTPGIERTEYVGVIHLDANPFERQHAGVVFKVDIPLGGEARSLEPGYHSTLSFMGRSQLLASPIMDDRWSSACLDFLRGAAFK